MALREDVCSPAVHLLLFKRKEGSILWKGVLGAVASLVLRWALLHAVRLLDMLPFPTPQKTSHGDIKLQ